MEQNVNDEECCINLKEVVCTKNVTLHFQKPYNFSCEFNLSSEYGKYMVIVSAGWYHYLEAGKYSRWRWEGLGSTYFDVFLYSMPKLQVKANPPKPIVTLPEVQGKERAYISRIAFNHPDVQRYVGYGYEIYKVVLANNSTAIVYFLTKATKPPWVKGITIAVPVDLEKKMYKSEVRFYLNLANMSDEQKEKAERILC